MKKVFPFIICVLLLGISCSNQSTELTDEQKATIISEVGEHVDGLTSANAQFNSEGWSEYWSEDEFISVISGIDFYDARSTWVDDVANAWSGVESMSLESYEKSVTPLSINLALVTMTVHGSTVLKSEEKIILTYQGSSIWQKEAFGWKIIHWHESSKTDPIQE